MPAGSIRNKVCSAIMANTKLCCFLLSSCIRTLQPDANIREVGVGCELDFTFNRTESRTRPNSAEIEALVLNTRKYLNKKFSEAAKEYFVDVALSNIGLPKHVTDTFELKFFASLFVTQDCPWVSRNVFEIMEGFDFDADYKINYVWKSTPMPVLEENVFYSTVYIKFKRAMSVQKFNTFRNFESEGKYFESWETRTSPHQEDSQVYNQRLWQQKVRNGGY